jgi:uncharacterized repeat protein (TIGR01451 family)
MILTGTTADAHATTGNTRRHLRAVLSALVVAAAVAVGTGAPTPVAADRNESAAGNNDRAAVITAGGFSTCAIDKDGGARCWGSGMGGQLGQDSSAHLGGSPGELGALAAIDLGAGRTATAVAAGTSHTCAVLDDDAVKCWGANSSGQLGQSSFESIGTESGDMAGLNAIDLGTNRSALAITAGLNHTCALLDNLAVTCWGQGFFGQTGIGGTATIGDGLDASGQPIGDAEMGDNLTPVDLGTGRTGRLVAAGDNHTCALLDNGTVKCWGHNATGQLGQGDTDDRGDEPDEMGANLPAVALGTGRTATAITAGAAHTCALLDNGTVKCWGGNGTGQLGQGDTDDRGDEPDEMGANLPAVALGTGRTATAITAGAAHTCALLDNGTVKCWGNDQSGTLGQGTSDRVVGDEANELGDGLPAIALGDGRIATAVTAGNDHTCALLDNGTMKCWGGNFFGQLGSGDIDDRGDSDGEMGDSLPSVTLPALVGPAGLTATMTASRTAAEVGDTITYTATLRNIGSAALTEVVVASNTAPSCGRTIASLALGASTTFTCTDTLTSADVPNTTHRLTVSTAQGATARTAALTTTVTSPPRPELAIAVTASATRVLVGETLTYVVTVTNTGNVTLHDTRISSNGTTCGTTVRELLVGVTRRYECARRTTNADSPSKRVSFTATTTGVASPTATVTTAVAPVVIRPDGMLRRAGQTSPFGNDIYNADGQGQSASTRVTLYNNVGYQWIVQNDGNTPRAFTLDGELSVNGIRVRYTNSTGERISKTVGQGTYRTAVLDPGKATSITLRLTVGGDSVRRALLLSASDSSGISDTVRINLRP